MKPLRVLDVTKLTAEELDRLAVAGFEVSCAHAHVNSVSWRDEHGFPVTERTCCECGTRLLDAHAGQIA
jgi:hypothetical protein